MHIPPRCREELERKSGCKLLSDTPDIANWLAQLYAAYRRWCAAS